MVAQFVLRRLRIAFLVVIVFIVFSAITAADDLRLIVAEVPSGARFEMRVEDAEDQEASPIVYSRTLFEASPEVFTWTSVSTVSSAS